jgi:hypothetical protein
MLYLLPHEEEYLLHDNVSVFPQDEKVDVHSADNIVDNKT